MGTPPKVPEDKPKHSIGINDSLNLGSMILLISSSLAYAIAPQETAKQYEYLFYLAIGASALLSVLSMILTAIYNRIDDAKSQILKAIKDSTPPQEEL